MPDNQLEAAMTLLGTEYDCKEVRQVMECLVTKNEDKMRSLTRDPIRLTTPILEKFAQNVKEIDKFYKKKDRDYRE